MYRNAMSENVNNKKINKWNLLKYDLHNDLSKLLKLLLPVGYRFLFFLIFTLSSSLYSLSAMLKESMYKAKNKKRT